MKEAVTNGWTVDKADGTQYRCYPKDYGLITGTPIAANGAAYVVIRAIKDWQKQKNSETAKTEES